MYHRLLTSEEVKHIGKLLLFVGFGLGVQYVHAQTDPSVNVCFRFLRHRCYTCFSRALEDARWLMR